MKKNNYNNKKKSNLHIKKNDKKNTTQNLKYKFIIYGVLFLMIISIVLSINKSIKQSYNSKDGLNAVKGQVTEILFDNTDEKPEIEDVNYCKYQEFKVRIEEGNHKNEVYMMRNTVETMEVYNIIVSKGDEIFVSVSEDEHGKIVNLHIFDISREKYLYIFVSLFLILLLIIGGYKGAKAIITLIFTGFMVVRVLLPLILKGHNPISISILVCIIIVSSTLLVIGGFNKKTLTAVLGTLGGVFTAGILALIVGYASKISGLANENAQMLAYLPNRMNMDFRGILFAGIIIGALGAVMDVSMSMASSMNEIEEIKPDISNKELMKSGMNIGKDIMGSMANTLILAYTGGALELMLLFMASGTKFREIINLDMVAAEIIRAIAGSIGLAITIPLTAIIAVLLKSSKDIRHIKINN